MSNFNFNVASLLNLLFLFHVRFDLVGRWEEEGGVVTTLPLRVPRGEGDGVVFTTLFPRGSGGGGVVATTLIQRVTVGGGVVITTLLQRGPGHHSCTREAG